MFTIDASRQPTSVNNGFEMDDQGVCPEGDHEGSATIGDGIKVKAQKGKGRARNFTRLDTEVDHELLDTEVDHELLDTEVDAGQVLD